MHPAVDWLWKINHKEMAACGTANYIEMALPAVVSNKVTLTSEEPPLCDRVW
jgi:hypothetical protein